MKHYAVIGRIPFDDEDSCYTYEADSRESAASMFKQEILEEHGPNPPTDASGEPVIINIVLESETPIKIV